MEYWIIDNNWRTIREFNSLSDAEHCWNNDRPKNAMQLLYGEGNYKPVRILYCA